MYFCRIEYHEDNICQDNPIFTGLLDYIYSYTTGSIAGARRLVENQSDIVINWSGGMHNAKKSEASGFSYVNDVVLAILELMKTGKIRVLQEQPFDDILITSMICGGERTEQEEQREEGEV